MTNLPQLPFVPRLKSYSFGITDDVIRTKFGTLPQLIRLDSRLPYSVSVDFLLNGVEHDTLMQFWQTHKTAWFNVMLTLEDSTLKPYPCLFADSPTIESVGGVSEWSDADIGLGKCDTHRQHYQSKWELIAMQPYRLETDLAIIAEMEARYA